MAKQKEDWIERAGKYIPNVGVVRVSGEIAGKIGDGAKGTASAIGRGAKGAWDGSTNFLYEAGRFNPNIPLSHRSRKVVLYQEPTLIPFANDIPFLRDRNINRNNIRTSIPFIMDGIDIPAVRTSKIESLHRSNYPRLLVVFRDFHPEYIGDETILVIPKGEAQDKFPNDIPDVSFMVWQPRRITVGRRVDSHEKRSIKIEQRDIDAMDIARELATNISTASDGSIKANPDDIMESLDMFTRYSKPLQVRWQILKDRYEFMVYRTNKPEKIASLIRSMVKIPREQMEQLVDVIANDEEVTGWGPLMKKIDSLPNVVAINGGAAIAEQHGMQTSVYRNNETISEEIPPSLFISSLGLPYFLEYLRESEEKHPAKIKELARQKVATVSEAFNFFITAEQLKGNSIRVGTQELASGQGKLDNTMRQVAREYLDLTDKQLGDGFIISDKAGRIKTPELAAENTVEGEYREQ